MRSPIDEVRGKIVSVDENSGDLIIKAHYDDWPMLIKRGYKECAVRLIDSRPLSDRQRKFCYAAIKDIADWSGTGATITKEHLKMRFMVDDLGEMGDKIFSLSNAPMSLIAAFQRYLIQFIIDFDVPVSFPILEYLDDDGDFLYICCLKRKCCICGQHADIHHLEGSRIGIGGDRTKVDHLGREVLPLCRMHHTEAESMGDKSFFAKYHLTHGVIADKAICRVIGQKKFKE